MDAQSFSLADLVAENARSYGDREAVLCGDERLTFKEIDERSSRLAAWLGDAKTVVWLGQNCHRAMETLFACAKLGAVFVPANWRLSAEETDYIVADSSPATVVRDGDELDYSREPLAPQWVDEDEPLVRMYTAAFEGRPRGAQLTHRNLLTSNLQIIVAQRVSHEDAFLVSVPLFHILGLGQMLAHFHAGARNVMLPRADPAEMARLIAAEKITRAVIIGPTKAALEEAGADLSELRTTPFAGYGQTEVAGIVSYDAWGPAGIGSHGRVAPLAALRIVDEDGSECALGDAGEIVVRGPQVMAGYAGGPERVRDGWHHTGDLGRREGDGSISFLGPMTDLIKTGAENVYPVEVEAALLRHRAVREACVIGIPDATWRAAVKAVVVVSEPVTPDELISFCKERIAGYKKPKAVEIVDSLPRTASGAVDRDDVKRRWGGA